MKRFAKAVVMVFLLSSLIGLPVWSGGGREAPDPDVTRIRHWQHLDHPEDPYFYDLIERFNAEHPDIEVEFELIPWGGAHELYTTSLAAGDAADVIFHVTSQWGTAFWDMGVLEPLDDYVAGWAQSDEIPQSAWDGSRAGPDEPIFGIPFTLLPSLLYYRADWFDQLGLDPPDTYEDFLHAARVITDEIDGAYGFAMRGSRGGTRIWLSFIMPAVDGEWFEADGRSTFRRPEAIEAAQAYIDLFQEHRVTPPSAVTDGFSELIEGFQSGLTGMLVHHVQSAASHVQVLGDERVGVAMMPAINGKRWSQAGLQHYVIPASSANKDAAFQLASWLAAPEQATFFGRTIGAVPALVDAAGHDPFFAEDRFMRASAASAEFSFDPPPLTTYGEFQESTWPTHFQRALLGEITAEEMMIEYARVLERGRR